MLQTNRVEIVDEENGVICIASIFVSCVMVLKLSKKLHFLKFWADLKQSDLKVIYIYVSESSHCTHSENYRGL